GRGDHPASRRAAAAGVRSGSGGVAGPAHPGAGGARGDLGGGLWPGAAGGWGPCPGHDRRPGAPFSGRSGGAWGGTGARNRRAGPGDGRRGARTAGGVTVNAYLQSVSNPAVYAAGDAAASGPPLTPTAAHEGEVVADN